MKPWSYQRLKRLKAAYNSLVLQYRKHPRRRGVRRCSADIDRELYLLIFVTFNPFTSSDRK